ncbi:MAG: hypothetical protein AB7Q37_08560 [Pyrinomonadaceae bacterium]
MTPKRTSASIGMNLYFSEYGSFAGELTDLKAAVAEAHKLA